MRTSFVESVLETLVADGVTGREASILAVCAGRPEHEVFTRLGFENAVISNVDERMSAEHFSPLGWTKQDATRLTMKDGSFDFVFVSDGLHHTSAPHAAILEMYRVARRGIIVIESRDSAVIRLAVRLGLSSEYEIDAVVDNRFESGGLDNSDVPNYVYRWTETEFTKLIRSYDPTGRHTFRFFYALNLPFEQIEMTRGRSTARMLRLAAPVLRGLGRVVKRQCNSFAMVVLKPRVPDDLWPWLASGDGEIHFDRTYVEARATKRS
jgi:SAM-dependent methyltransferase